MGFLCESDDKMETVAESSSKTAIPEWMSKGGEDLFKRASTLSETPFSKYTGPRVADFSGDTNAAFGAIRGSTGAYKPMMDKAGAFADLAGRQFTDPGVIDSYTNPYQKAVSDISAREVTRAHDSRLPGRSGRAVAMGAYGSPRNLWLEEEGERNLSQTIGDIYNTGGYAGFQAAGQRFDADRAAAGSSAGAFADLARMGQGLNLTDANALLKTGAIQQGKAKERMDVDYGDYQEGQDWPYKNIAFASDILRGTPYDTTRTGSQQQLVPQTNPWQQAIGTGLAVGSMFI